MLYFLHILQFITALQLYDILLCSKSVNGFVVFFTIFFVMDYCVFSDMHVVVEWSFIVAMDGSAVFSSPNTACSCNCS